jgi:hypothetical protein
MSLRRRLPTLRSKARAWQTSQQEQRAHRERLRDGPYEAAATNAYASGANARTMSSPRATGTPLPLEALKSASRTTGMVPAVGDKELSQWLS